MDERMFASQRGSEGSEGIYCLMTVIAYRWIKNCISLYATVRPKELWMADCTKTGENAPSRSRTARAHPKIEVFWRHMRARERWFEECIAILYLISDLLYGVPGCTWEWLTEQKPAKMRARAVGLRGRTLKSRLSGDTWELERDGLRYV